MRPDLPIHIVVGEMDPVNGQLALVNAVVDRYRQAGLLDVSLRVFPGARHEVLNEINRAEVFGDIVDWMSATIAI
jgi:alpha-beta hydrolase superfamily lysophospholipase